MSPLMHSLSAEDRKTFGRWVAALAGVYSLVIAIGIAAVAFDSAGRASATNAQSAAAPIATAWLISLPPARQH